MTSLPSKKKMADQSLTKFQKIKLEYYFNFFDADGNKSLDMNDFKLLMEKILDYTSWESDSIEGKECYEVCHVFYEVMTDKAERDQAGGKVELKVWFDLWNKLLPGCKGLGNLPIWLRRLTPTLFKIIDYKEDGVIDIEELACFYQKMVGLPEDVAQKRAIDGFKQMTDNGRYNLDIHGYEQIFANFLIGRTLLGPGRYIFGCFEDKVEPFQILQPAVEEDDVDTSNLKKSAQRRGSIDLRVKMKYNSGV
ncbi:hypothetical protein LOTGIDRAFT_236745 [Lottia gigantea]|uniref:EF-hand domain-containing protein n=1 Tax=Lottia gigantea TaxID=225164 RepID=V4B402_LOTGI|nr:hypothetical protein LOTGIDRAFT_236745 [Lottia gigantea]ESO83139.1 hypothetical protein LOTGIDRAFT_236745 [Lottia gigantea]